jgi:hypothetical protein
MFALFKKRELVSYQAKYKHTLIKGCATIYSYNQPHCIEQLKQHEINASGIMPEHIVITARSPY